MGLSGRREKQRIPNDPRNLSWADDATKFGQAYLSKLGWDSSKGLGIEGDGRTSHIKVSQKLDMLGIGAAHSKDVNGIAWKQNKEFEELLRRLNEGTETEAGTDKAREECAVEENDKEKKRKRKKNEDEPDEKQKKKRKKDKSTDDSAMKKQHKLMTADGDTAQVVVEETTSVTVAASVKVAPVKVAPRRPAHRARYIASKNLASKSASAISEILGIAPTSSSATTLPSTPTSTPTQGMLTQLDDSHTLEKLTTSTKSVADYFKERLIAKTAGMRPLSSSSRSESVYDGEDELPKGGLGSSRLGIERTEEGAARVGIGIGMSKFGSLMSGAFLASLPTVAVTQKAVATDATGTLDLEDQNKTTESTTDNPEGKNGVKKAKREKRREKAAERDEPTVNFEDEEVRLKEKKARKEKRRQKHEERDGVQKKVEAHENADVRSADEARKKAERKVAKKARGHRDR